MIKLNSWQIIQGTILAVVVVICAAVFVSFFQQIPIASGSMAIDWKKIWPAIEGGSVHYAAGVLMNPPWSALLVSPLGWLSLQASWGLLAFLTILILVISVPRVRQRGRYLLSILLLVMSFPALRHMIDGNFEALIIAGTLLIVYGYNQRLPVALAAGLLLIASKPQSGTLLIAVIGLYGLLKLREPSERRYWLTTALTIAVIVIPFLIWKGGDWLNAMLSIPERSSIMDVSMMAALNRTTIVPSPFIFIIWFVFIIANIYIAWRTRFTLNREKAAMYIAASLLIAPYASGNSILTILAVGVIPLFQARPRLGLILIAMIDCLFLWNKDMLFYYQAYFQALTLLTIWAVLAWRTLTLPPSVPIAATKLASSS